VFDRCRSVADVLSYVAEAAPTRDTKLFDIQRRVRGDHARAIRVVRALRNDRAHADDATCEETRRLVADFRRLDNHQQSSVIKMAASDIGYYTQFAALPRFVEALL